VWSSPSPPCCDDEIWAASPHYWGSEARRAGHVNRSINWTKLLPTILVCRRKKQWYAVSCTAKVYFGAAGWHCLMIPFFGCHWLRQCSWAAALPPRLAVPSGVGLGRIATVEVSTHTSSLRRHCTLLARQENTIAAIPAGTGTTRQPLVAWFCAASTHIHTGKASATGRLLKCPRKA